MSDAPSKTLPIIDTDFGITVPHEEEVAFIQHILAGGDIMTQAGINRVRAIRRQFEKGEKNILAIDEKDIPEADKIRQIYMSTKKSLEKIILIVHIIENLYSHQVDDYPSVSSVEISADTELKEQTKSSDVNLTNEGKANNLKQILAAFDISSDYIAAIFHQDVPEKYVILRICKSARISVKKIMLLLEGLK